MNFLANRHIAVVDPAAGSYPDYDTIVYSMRIPPVPPEAVVKGVKMGHYVVLTTQLSGEDASDDR